MISTLRKALAPVSFALALIVMIGAVGSAPRTAYAAEGDICAVSVGAQRGEAAPVLGEDALGNDVWELEFGTTYGLVFRVEDQTDENVTVRIDSETGSALIVSKAEILDFEGGRANVGHQLVKPGVLTQTVDVIHPIFNDADGDRISLSDWLFSVSYSNFVPAGLFDPSECGTPFRAAAAGPPVVTEAGADGWGFINFECHQPGFFWIDILAPDDTEETGMSVKFECPAERFAETAEISASALTVETVPALNELDGNVLGIPANQNWSLITVTVRDQFGRRVDGVEVTFITDNCRFQNTTGGLIGGVIPTITGAISPAGGGTIVTATTDTEATGADQNFITNNPLEMGQAGTAEVFLNCAGGTAGVANVRASVDRPGADIQLGPVQITVIGPVALNGLTLTLTPTSLICGGPVTATVNAVDANNRPVSPGTRIFFTTDASSGVVGGGILGSSGAQGVSTVAGGTASVNISTDPSKPGIHTVTAHAIGVGGVLVQVSRTYECTAPAQQIQIVGGGQVPTTTAPSTGTGTGATGTISPPRTGDAGLAAASGSNASLLVIAGAVAFALAGLASVRFARR